MKRALKFLLALLPFLLASSAARRRPQARSQDQDQTQARREDTGQ